jgi:hypothetical protein
MDLVREHHLLERRLWDLRFLEAVGHADYSEADEDAVADEMEAIWYRMSDAERRRLEEERARDREFRIPGPMRDPSTPMVDVDEDGRSRRGVAPRVAAGA